MGVDRPGIRGPGPLPALVSSPLRFVGAPADPGFGSSEERAAAAVGALLVVELIRHGGCTLPVGPAQNAADRLLATFPETDRRRLEAEAVEMLIWLEDSLSLLGDDWRETEDADSS